jgi:hypothetical protein
MSHEVQRLDAQNRRLACKAWPDLNPALLKALQKYSLQFRLSIAASELVLISGSWYVTHSGLLALASRRRCKGIEVEAVFDLCDLAQGRFVFKATVHASGTSRQFVGYGDADPSNVSPLVRGAELRVAETRAVNRALRKAYGIGICSVEEIGSVTPPPASGAEAERNIRKVPPEIANGKNIGHGSNGNANGIRVRVRLCQVIRQHSLDADLVKAYAIDFCGTKTLREASREQVESFVAHLADWAAKDRNALLCQLNSYPRPQAGAA